VAVLGASVSPSCTREARTKGTRHVVCNRQASSLTHVFDSSNFVGDYSCSPETKMARVKEAQRFIIPIV
jgi:hypothetical protein